jgi:predicted transcriptional regulator
MSAPTNGTATSNYAALTMEPHLERLEALCRDAITGALAGLTCDELEQETGLAHQTASARVNALWRDGLIQRTAEKRKTRSGRFAFVYRAA